jgi:hypothetical protein
MLSWAPYLLNLFLDDCKDAQDLGTEFHYSWLIVLIALIGWGEPTYSHFCDRVGKFHATRYTSLGNTSDPKQRSGNASTFTMYLNEMKEKIASSWRITLEVVTQYQGIAKFKATRHNMWIQACRDPKKEWLQLRYCVNTEEVDWAIKDWEDDWKVPVITKELPKDKETEVGPSQTSAGDIRMVTQGTKATGGSATTKKLPQRRSQVLSQRHRKRTTH